MDAQINSSLLAQLPQAGSSRNFLFAKSCGSHMVLQRAARDDLRLLHLRFIYEYTSGT